MMKRNELVCALMLTYIFKSFLILFCCSSRIIILQPTNHLDLEAVLWLESYLTEYKHTVVIVSHDRGKTWQESQIKFKVARRVNAQSFSFFLY
jgi:ABC-type lipoprotein export system ATPase subunit